MIFLNLTNGLEMLLTRRRLDWHMVRIQSTWCEQKRWSAIVEELSDEFLFFLAQGVRCEVMDYNSKDRPPRALWQGLPWIKYATERCWFDRHRRVYVRGNDVTRYFGECYDELGERAKKKLNYARRFLTCDRCGW